MAAAAAAKAAAAAAAAAAVGQSIYRIYRRGNSQPLISLHYAKTLTPDKVMDYCNYILSDPPDVTARILIGARKEAILQSGDNYILSLRQ